MERSAAGDVAQLKLDKANMSAAGSAGQDRKQAEKQPLLSISHETGVKVLIMC